MLLFVLGFFHSFVGKKAGAERQYIRKTLSRLAAS